MVDDDEADYFQVSHLLKRSQFVDYVLTWAKSYQEGMQALDEGDFDIAIFDYKLGAATGIELLQAAKLYRSDLPVILLTGHDNSEIDFLASKAGAADYLCKNGLTQAQLERSIRYSLRHAETLAALRHSQQQLELFMRQVPCAVCICDPAGRPIFQNELAEQCFEPASLQLGLQGDATPGPRIAVVGGRHWLVSTFPMLDEDGVRLQGFAGTDITERVKSEEELRRTSKLLNGILDSLSVLACRMDAQGNVLEMRGRGMKELGWRESEMVGTNLVEKFPETAAAFQQALNGEPASLVLEATHEGRRLHFEQYLHLDKERGDGVISFAVNVTARVEAEAERNRQARLLNDVIKKMPVILGQLDAEGRVVDVRGEGLTGHGITTTGLLGRKFAEVYPASREAIERALRSGEVNFTLNGPPGENQWQVDFYAAAYNGSGATFFGRDVSERRWLERRLLSATDTEQQRIGADLHDGLGQKLTGLACLATALRQRLATSDPQLAEQSDFIARLSNEAIAESRALARGLCPVELEQSGLISALIELTGQTGMIHGIACQLEAPDAPPACDHLSSVHLYRITQEAINNALRHGGATKIRVSLRSVGNRHRLEIEDNGRGFDLGKQRQLRNNGLRLMEYRATMIGGTLLAESEPGRGTRIICRFETNAQSGFVRRRPEPQIHVPRAASV